MRITLESDYALRILTHLAMQEGVVGAGTVSDETSVTPRFALKILNKLTKGGLIHSYKGAKGGYELAVAPHDITLRVVIELIDGPIAIARCVEGGESCSLNCDKAACIYHHIFDGISAELASKLDGITIGDVIDRILKREV